MINENFINFNFEPNYMNHDDTYPHGHHHTPAKMASQEYQECMHKKKNEKKCRENSLRVYENNISAEEKYINCKDTAKTGFAKRSCDNTFNKDNKYSYTSAYGAYEQADLRYCMKDELEKNIKKICQDCDKKSKKFESSVAEDMYYESCNSEKKKCEKKYDNTTKCIDNLKTGEPETEECLKDIMFKSLYGPCYEHKGTDVRGFIGIILKYILGPMKKGIFYFLYFAFTVMTVVFFGGIFFSILWMFVLFMYSFLGNNGSRAFPGIIVFESINKYMYYVHPYVLLISCFIWAVLFGVCIMLYFFKKMFGNWPATWVWKAIGLFPGNEKQVFDWFDRMFGCMGKSGRKALYCHNHNLWMLIEDWMVEFAQTVLKIDKTEVEIKNAINSFRNLGNDDIKIAYSIEKIAEEAKNKSENQGKKVVNEKTDNIKEEFTLYNNKKKNKYIEENFILENAFDMNEFDNIMNDFKDFKNVIQELKKNSKDKYEEQEKDSQAFENEAESRKIKETEEAK